MFCSSSGNNQDRKGYAVYRRHVLSGKVHRGSVWFKRLMFNTCFHLICSYDSRLSHSRLHCCPPSSPPPPPPLSFLLCFMLDAHSEAALCCFAQMERCSRFNKRPLICVCARGGGHLSGRKKLCRLTRDSAVLLSAGPSVVRVVVVPQAHGVVSHNKRGATPQTAQHVWLWDDIRHCGRFISSLASFSILSLSSFLHSWPQN